VPAKKCCDGPVGKVKYLPNFLACGSTTPPPLNKEELVSLPLVKPNGSVFFKSPQIFEFVKFKKLPKIILVIIIFIKVQ
jgi:hypothetical protein